MRKSLAAIGAIAIAAVLFGGAGTSITVTTAAAASPQNTVDCGPTIVHFQNDSGVQLCEATGDNARCVEKSDSPDVVQTCIINQANSVGDNDAKILQDNSTGGSSTSGAIQTQHVQQIAMVTQGGANNRVDATQDVNQSLSAFGSVTQNQDADQTITVCQGAGDCHSANTGVNTSNIHQSRSGDAHANGGAIQQNQDVGSIGDCFRTVCADVEQNSSNQNNSDLQQQDHLRQNASSVLGPVMQKQQQPTEGIDGHVDQPIGTTAQNKNVAHEHLTDDMNGPHGSTQSQDPGLGCCSHQAGNGQSNTDIHLVGVLHLSEPGGYQQLDIFGNCVSNGSCLTLAHGKVNGAQDTERCSDTASGESPAACEASVECSSAGEETAAACGPPIDVDLASLGFDTFDFQRAINFVFPVALPTTPL